MVPAGPISKNLPEGDNSPPSLASDHMKTFVYTYPYFTGSLFALALFGLALWRSRSQRRQVLIAGLLSTPSGFCAVLFVPEYWQPVQLFYIGFGPEDLIFSFSNGGLVWLIVAAVHSRQSREVRIEAVPVLRRSTAISASFFVLWVAFLAVGLEVMRSSILAALLVLAALLRREPGLLSLAPAGALLFGVPYTVFCSGFFRLFPGFLEQWNLTRLSGWFVLGVPLEELAWGLAWGATWPVVLSIAFDLRVETTRCPRTNRAAVRKSATA